MSPFISVFSGNMHTCKMKDPLVEIAFDDICSPSDRTGTAKLCHLLISAAWLLLLLSL